MKYLVIIGTVREVVEAADETDAVAIVRGKHACDERINPEVRPATPEDELVAEASHDEGANSGSADGV